MLAKTINPKPEYSDLSPAAKWVNTEEAKLFLFQFILNEFSTNFINRN